MMTLEFTGKDWRRQLHESMSRMNAITTKSISIVSMFRTPDISHFRSQEYDEFYEPAEDSFLFLDALEKDVKSIEESWFESWLF